VVKGLLDGLKCPSRHLSAMQVYSGAIYSTTSRTDACREKLSPIPSLTCTTSIRREFRRPHTLHALHPKVTYDSGDPDDEYHYSCDRFLQLLAAAIQETHQITLGIARIPLLKVPMRSLFCVCRVWRLLACIIISTASHLASPSCQISGRRLSKMKESIRLNRVVETRIDE